MNKTFTCDVATRQLLVIGFKEDFVDTLSQSENFVEHRYEILEMNNAIRAYSYLIDTLESGLKLPDAILCNHDFLTDDNYFLLENTRNHQSLRSIPFILFARNKADFDATELLKKGVDDCYIEPVAWIDLQRRIEFLIQYKSEMMDYKALEVHNQVRIPIGKRLFDIVFAFAILLILSPVLLAIAILIKTTSRGPIIYRSKRVGTGYQVFDFLKFRSMVVDADIQLEKLAHLNHYGEGKEEEVSGFVKLNNDPRITTIGKIIRKTSLDELPQLFNVLMGDMSIVGNRPLPLYEAEQMTKDVWAARFLCPAGITGLWQTCKEGKDNLTVAQRAQLDVEYAMNYSFLLDAKILSRTLPAMIQKES